MIYFPRFKREECFYSLFYEPFDDLWECLNGSDDIIE